MTPPGGPFVFSINSFWVEGPPTESGYWLLRCMTHGRPWIYLVSVCQDPTSHDGKMMYRVGGAGNRLGDWGLKHMGTLTHHAKPNYFFELLTDLDNANKACTEHMLALLEARNGM